MVMVSPLHMAIDAGRWDGERLLGRLIIVVHAAFLDAGFVPVPHRSGRNPSRVPRQAGRTALALSLRYDAPQLLHREDAEAAVLRIQAHGRWHLVLYVLYEPKPWLVEHCVLVDALAAAPGGRPGPHDAALRSDARLAGLWRRLSDDLCRRALVATCRRRNGVALEPTFTSLPGRDLARLTNGADLARAELVCTGLRRLVAHRDRELWEPMYEALRLASSFTRDGGSPERRSRLHTPPPFSFQPGDEAVLSYLWQLVDTREKP
ncbi:hypothetical protein SETIT_3G269700v2 [Setaria italica]|uniref:Uncharacterized protein n=2 Tax=Setaria italica TaxID=4555 RepID=A0A368QJE9_SETIT|nr:hypothetical protein SETIT_3G269700v2 [Setaria italica]